MTYGVKASVELMCLRIALNVDKSVMAQITGVTEEVYTEFEAGNYVPGAREMLDNSRNYITSFDEKEYYKVRLMQETLLLDYMPDEYKLKVLAHISAHAAKYQMALLCGR